MLKTGHFSPLLQGDDDDILISAIEKNLQSPMMNLCVKFGFLAPDYVVGRQINKKRQCSCIIVIKELLESSLQ